jgi:hypothetical protein
VRRSEAKTHRDPQGLSHHVGSPEPGTASVIPPTKTQAAVPDDTLRHA